MLIIGSDSFIAGKFISQYSDKFSISSLSRIETGVPNEYIVQDLNKIDPMYFKNKKIVINFAAIVHRPDIKDEQIYDEVNHKLTVLNATKAKQEGVKLFIQMSTVAVYGKASYITYNTPVNPENPYARSKLKADEALLSMQDGNFKVCIIRPPMVYGGGNSPGNMMRLIGLANKAFPLPFKGIDNKRDFINVNNLIQYISAIAEKQLCGIYLVTDHEPVSTEHLLLTISKYLGKKAMLIKLPDWILKFLKFIRPGDFDKLFGTLQIESNFPFEYLINRYSVYDGINEMVNSIDRTKGY